MAPRPRLGLVGAILLCLIFLKQWEVLAAPESPEMSRNSVWVTHLPFNNAYSPDRDSRLLSKKHGHGHAFPHGDDVSSVGSKEAQGNSNEARHSISDSNEKLKHGDSARSYISAGSDNPNVSGEEHLKWSSHPKMNHTRAETALEQARERYAQLWPLGAQIVGALEAIAFLLVSGLSGYQLVTLSKAAQTQNAVGGLEIATQSWIQIAFTGHVARCLLMWLFFAANLMRAMSLLCLLFWIRSDPSTGLAITSEAMNNANHLEKWTAFFGQTYDDFQSTDIMEWDIYALHVFPTLFFLATYWVAALFWAQLYYAANSVRTHSLKGLFWFGTLGVMGCFISCAVVTRALKNFVLFRTCSLLLIGCLHLLIATSLTYFGFKVMMQLRSQSHWGSNGVVAHHKTLVRRVFLLSFVCPLIFVLRGSFCLLFVFNLVPSYHPNGISHLGWDALVYFLGELIPGVFILFSFWSTNRIFRKSLYPFQCTCPRSPFPNIPMDDSLSSAHGLFHNNLTASLLDSLPTSANPPYQDHQVNPSGVHHSSYFSYNDSRPWR